MLKLIIINGFGGYRGRRSRFFSSHIRICKQLLAFNSVAFVIKTRRETPFWGYQGKNTMLTILALYDQAAACYWQICK